MAQISPFNGIRYNPDVAGQLNKVVAPPYDVISPEEQDALYQSSPFNCVRIILNRSEPTDDTQGPYQRAAGFLDDWLFEGVLKEDDEQGLYLYRQEYTNPADGRRYSRTGLFCALALEPYSAGIVLPHEETRTKAKEDRLRLMSSTRANPEPIYGLYEDASGYLARTATAAAEASSGFAVDVEGDLHEVRRISNPDAIHAIQKYLQDQRIWIADGHHRYETALLYRDERRTGEGAPNTQPVRASYPTPDTHAYDSILVVLSAFSDPGLVVMPTHRLIKNVSPGKLEQLLLQLERYFQIEPVPLVELAERMKADPSTGVHRFGMVNGEKAWVVTLSDEDVMDIAVEGHCEAWRRLDVSILHTLILERSLGIPVASLAKTPDVGYTRSRDEAIDKVRSCEYQLAFLLNDPTADEVRQVASAGDKMPPKSTFFYPKLWSGLLMRRL